MDTKKAKQVDFKLSTTQLSHKGDDSSKPLHKSETGSGQIVVLCHGAASHSGQWKALIKELAQGYRVIAFDQYGYRKSSLWTENRPMLIQDQAAPIISFLQNCFQLIPQTVHLVGHSHGASIVAYIASQLSENIASLSMYEPNTFGILKSNDDDRQKYEEIVDSFGDLHSRMNTAQNREIFAEDLMDFWLGDGSWVGLEEKLKSQLISVMQTTAQEVYSALHSNFDLSPLIELEMRVHMMYDPYSPPAARLVTERYIDTLENAQVSTFDHCGHLAPIFHAKRVNQKICEHIKCFSL